MHYNTEQQPERVGQDVALGADHFLPRIIAGRVECRNALDYHVLIPSALVQE